MGSKPGEQAQDKTPEKGDSKQWYLIEQGGGMLKWGVLKQF